MNKICTSLEQSQKLLELGIDVYTADMFYTLIDQGLYLEVKQGIEPSKDDIPCWSLAALFDLLPNNEHITTTLSRGSWKIDTVEYVPNTWWCEYEDTENQTEFNISADNPVDACVEMIIKLHEQNIL